MFILWCLHLALLFLRLYCFVILYTRLRILSHSALSLASLFRADQNEPGGPLAGPPTSNPAYMPRKFAFACLTGNLADVEQYLQVAVVARGLKSVEMNGTKGLRGKYHKDVDRYDFTYMQSQQGGGNKKKTVRIKSKNLITINKHGEEILQADAQHFEKTLLEHRFGQLRRSPLMFCVIGAGLMALAQGQGPGKHQAIADVLLDRGARPNCLDLLGRSVLWYGTGAIATEVGFIISKRCNKMCSTSIKLVDQRDRLGEVVLQQAIMMCARGKEKELTFVCQVLKANPNIKDFNGCSGLSMTMMYPTAKTILSSAASKNMKKSLRQDRQSQQCGGPDCEKIGKKFCSRCHIISYCGAICQRNDWNSHKKNCKQKAIHVAVLKKNRVPKGLVASSFSFKKGGSSMSPDWKGNPPSGVNMDEEFVVKIQWAENLPLMVYDKSRTLHLMVEDDERSTHVNQIVKMIKESGVMGLKGYFRAKVRKCGELEVYYNKMATPKKW